MATGIQRNNGTPPAAKRGFLELLEVAAPQIAKIMPPGVKAERAIQIARAQFLADPKLQACEPGSILRAIGQSCQLGLEVGAPKGEAYLVPYGQTCTLIVGYRGLAELARRSGRVLDIDADVVREGDRFSYGRNPLPYLEHMPALADRGEVSHVYAVAVLPGPLVKYAVLEAHEVDAIRKRSRSGGSGPWASDWCEMAKKTAVRRLVKLLPQSTELAAAIAHDNATDGLLTTTVQAAPVPRQSVSERLAGRLAAPAPQEQQEAATDDDEGREPGED
jgi:recombination protein RecT